MSTSGSIEALRESTALQLLQKAATQRPGAGQWPWDPARSRGLAAAQLRRAAAEPPGDLRTRGTSSATSSLGREMMAMSLDASRWVLWLHLGRWMANGPRAGSPHPPAEADGVAPRGGHLCPENQGWRRQEGNIQREFRGGSEFGQRQTQREEEKVRAKQRRRQENQA